MLLNNFTSAADHRAALLSEVHLNAETLQLQLGSYPLWKPLDEMGGLSHLSWRMDQPILAARMGRPDLTPTLP